MEVTNSGKGNRPTYVGAASVSELLKLGVTGQVTPLPDGKYIIGAQVNFGAGLDLSLNTAWMTLSS